MDAAILIVGGQVDRGELRAADALGAEELADARADEEQRLGEVAVRERIPQGRVAEVLVGVGSFGKVLHPYGVWLIPDLEGLERAIEMPIAAAAPTRGLA